MSVLVKIEKYFRIFKRKIYFLQSENVPWLKFEFLEKNLFKNNSDKEGNTIH